MLHRTNDRLRFGEVELDLIAMAKAKPHPNFQRKCDLPLLVI
jgi:hypothetical protein